MSKTQKEIKEIDIFQLHAQKAFFCGPPEIWELEALLDVRFTDGTKEIQYISRIDLDEDGWQLMTKSINEIQEDDDVKKYIITCFEDEEQIRNSPYCKVIAQLDPLFKQIAVI